MNNEAKIRTGKRRLAGLLAAVALTGCLAIGACSGGKTEQNGVILGKNDFLFPAESGTYSYVEDYLGNSSFSEEQLSSIRRTLVRRAAAYSHSGADYYLVLLPNVQTVYSENMPASLGEKGSVSLRTQLTDYLVKNGVEHVLDLTDTLLEAKEAGQLYSNTENALSALGAYYVYDALFHALPAELTASNTFRGDLKNKLIRVEEKGGALADQAGVERVRVGYTLPLSEEETLYMSAGESVGCISTFAKVQNKSVLPLHPGVLLEMGRASDRDNLLPYFANTFGSAGFKLGWEYKPGILSSVVPQAVFQLVYEDELYTLLDNELNASYNAALRPGDDPTTTATPEVLSTIMVSQYEACIVGTVEEDAVITVSGAEIDTYETTAQAGRFFLPVKLPGDDPVTVSLTAKVGEKDESIPAQVKVSPAGKGNYLTVFAGTGSQLHYPDTLPDYYCTNLWGPSAQKSLVKSQHRKLEKIRAATGKDTKLVYLFAPDCITAYPETATAEMIAAKGSDYSRLNLFADLFADDPDILVVDSTELIRANKDKGKLYYQTDTHWNTLGAYFGYYALMSEIAKDYPDAAPRELDQYEITQAWEAGGDLVSFLGCGNDVASEYKTFCTPKFTNRAEITDYYTGSKSYEYSGMLRCVVRDDSLKLPTAVMLCDSFGANLFDFVSDSFSVLVRQNMWSYETNLELLAELQPDYYIHCYVERDMGNVMAG